MSEGQSSLSEALAHAVALHQQGRLDQAEGLYLEVLRLNPRHFDALHLLGVIAQQQGQAGKALAFISQAIAINPAVAAAHSNLGLALQSLKRPLEALACYGRALALQPGYAEALYNRGNALQELGRPEEALGSFGQALALNPDYADAWFNQGKALHALNRLEEAEASYTQALRLRPGDAEAHFSRANALLGLDRVEAAVEGYGQALACRPGYVEALNNRGFALHLLGRLDEALADCDEALRLRPDYLDTLINRGCVLLGLGRVEEALACSDQALRLQPGDATALNNRGNALRELKRTREALASYTEALAVKPGFAEAMNNRGNALQDLNRLEESLACYDQALLLRPGYADALNNRGNVLRQLNRLGEALDCFGQALESRPGYAEAFCNRGICLQAMGRFDEALADYAQASRIKPDLAEAHWNMSMTLLAQGDFDRGFEKYEWRWGVKLFGLKKRAFQQARWTGGESLQGKTILMHAEQGLGDTIQFCRYARLAAAAGAMVWLEVQPALKSLLSGVEGASEVFAKGDPLPGFDCHCPLLSLPLAFKTRLDTIPAEPRYLRADPAIAAVWQGRLGGKELPRIGLAWSGNAIHSNDSNRSAPLAEFTKLLPGPGKARIISVQKEVRPADLPILEGRGDIERLGEGLGDFGDTAGLVENLDLVITVDTAVAHLAAALGKPVWLLLPFNADWRWLLGRTDSPWYPTVRLFRQTATGGWGGVIEEAALALAGFLNQTAAGPSASLLVDEAFRQAQSLHCQGRRGEAQALYQAILRDDPGYAGALHLLGVSALEEGDNERGIDWVRRSLRLDPAQAGAHANLGAALRLLNRPEEALACFAKALDLNPDDADAFNNRGNVFLDLGRAEEALADYERALGIRPDYAEVLSNRGNALQSLGRLEDALASYEQALRLRPDYAVALNNRGNVLQKLGRLEEALACFDEALRLAPGFVEAFFNRGNALLALQRPQEALDSFDSALRLKPDHEEALNNRGNVLLGLGRKEEALAAFVRVCEMSPGHLSATINCGLALLGLKRHEEALACFDEALRIKPDSAEAINNRGSVLLEMARTEDALACYSQALRLKPDFSNALYNTGFVLHTLRRYEEALAYYERAVAVKPDYAEAVCNYGVTLQALGRYEQALASFRRSWEMAPSPQAIWNEGLLRLLLGDYEQGFEQYEWRWETEPFLKHRQSFDRPLWLGKEPLRGKTLFLHAEQGLGDTIQFCRYARLAVAAGATVLLAVQPSLKSLLAGVEGASGVFTTGDPLPGFDCHCPLLSLPLAFKTRLDTIPAQARYLKADPAIAAAWQGRLGGQDLPRIGLAWSGNATHTNDSNRSAPLAEFAKLLPTRGKARIISLQKEVRPADLPILEGLEDIERLGEGLGDFGDTAGLVENLDLVIAVDTAVAHLAAALGKPVWLLLPFDPDWRWHLGRSDSPWYPTVRLFRQKAPGDWGGIVAEAAWALDRFLGEAGGELPAPLPPEKSLPSLTEAFQLKLDDAGALSCRGDDLLDQGRLEEALDAYDQALRIRPDFAEAHNNRGHVLQKLGRFEEALACFDEALRHRPDLAEAIYNRGNALLALSRPQEALDSYDSTLRLKPDHVELLNNRGNALIDMGRPEEALASYAQALRLRPHFVDALYNSALALHSLRRYEEALPFYERALSVEPDYVEAISNYGVTLQAMGRYEQALASYERALRIAPDSAQAHLNRGLVLMLLGDYGRGFEEFEWRWGTKAFIGQKWSFSQPLWLGKEPLKGKTLFLHAEQGLGDTIQFCRYARLAAAAGATVLLGVQPPLKPLLAGVEGASGVFTSGDPLPDFDCHCPLPSLPLAFKTRLDTIPAQARYLKADPALAAAWRKRLGRGGLPRVGLAWSGSSVYINDRNRSAPLAEFAKLLPGPGKARIISLQKEVRPADLPILERRGDIERLGEGLGDFGDTAGLVENLDLVIAVDTAVAHLAAALGKPVWLLLPFNPDWRWLLGRGDSPWYPTVRLFRQKAPGDWGGVVAEAAWALERFLGGVSSEPPVSRLPEETFGQALALHRQGRRGEAQALYQAILRDDPSHAGALHMLGVSALEEDDTERGIGLIRRSLQRDPAQAGAHANLGTALRKLNRSGEALAAFAEAIKLQPDDADVRNKLGSLLLDLGRPVEALDAYEQILRVSPDFAEVHNNRGNALQALGRFEEALAGFDRALQIKPGFVEACYNRGNLLAAMRRPGDAARSFAQALEIAPDYPYALGLKLFMQMQCCDWTDYAKDSEAAVQAVKSGKGAQLPFDFLAFSHSAADQWQCARRFIADRFAGTRPNLAPGQPYGHDKIRLAYLSGDFREHALSFSLAGLFEAHDRERFETTAISFTPAGPGEMRERLRQAFDRFEDVGGLSDLDVARRLRELEIDIAIDLSGYTAGARTGILMHRPAPVQVSYLGYPGTLGGEHLDYIVADACVIPESEQAFYSEQIVHLPDTYWVSDTTLALPERIPSRAEAGLPEQGFVFCCFNNNYKITPAVFSIWMRLLGRVEGSVLWLFGGGGPVVWDNLRKEAARSGIAPQRLVFAPHVSRREDHLARQRLADLFLDTLPYNAHATASDALWGGLPVLTCQGSAFAGRVAASLLRAIGLPELITESLEDYEALALRLATAPGLLDGIKAKLAENRKTYPLFDTDRFRRHLEAAYVTMWQRHQRGEPPVGFSVPSLV